MGSVRRTPEHRLFELKNSTTKYLRGQLDINIGKCMSFHTDVCVTTESNISITFWDEITFHRKLLFAKNYFL